MKGPLASLSLVLSLVAFCLGIALAQEDSEWTAWANMDAASSYLSVSSGKVLSKNPSLQPSAGLERKDGFGFCVWADYTLGDADTDQKLTEIDPGIHVPFPESWPVGGDISGTLFFIPGDMTGEMVVNVSPKQSILGGIDVRLSAGQAVFNSPSSANGMFVTGAVSRVFNLTDNLSTIILGDITWCDRYIGVSGWSHAHISGGLNYNFSDGWSASGKIIRQIPIRDDAEYYTVGVVSISKTFQIKY